MTTDFLKYTNAFIIGAAKSATTTVAKVLRDHPQVCICTPKEPSFFAFDEEYDKGLEYYNSLFKPTDETKVTLEGSTTYSRCTIFPHTAQRIYQVTPKAKFIYMMRHPVDRAYAHYKHRWLREVHPGKPFTETFEEYVKHDPMCTDDSLYKLQIDAYLKYFTEEQFLFCLTEDLDKDFLGLIDKICQHLEIEKLDQSTLQETVKVNDSNKVRDIIVKRQIRSSPLVKAIRVVTTPQLRQWSYNNILSKTSFIKNLQKSFTPLPMKPETRQQLIDYYSDTIAWVEETMGRKLPHWYK